MNGWQHNPVARKIVIHLKAGPASLDAMTAAMDEPRHRVATALRQLIREELVGKTPTPRTGRVGRPTILYYARYGDDRP